MPTTQRQRRSSAGRIIRRSSATRHGVIAAIAEGAARGMAKLRRDLERALGFGPTLEEIDRMQRAAAARHAAAEAARRLQRYWEILDEMRRRLEEEEAARISRRIRYGGTWAIPPPITGELARIARVLTASPAFLSRIRPPELTMTPAAPRRLTHGRPELARRR
jgi:hypothetical protein